MCVVAGLLDRTAPRAAFRSGAHSHSIGVSGASWSYAAGAVGALVQADGVWVRVTGSEALKTVVAGKELRGVGSSTQEEKFYIFERRKDGEIVFSLSHLPCRINSGFSRQIYVELTLY